MDSERRISRPGACNSLFRAMSKGVTTMKISSRVAAAFGLGMLLLPAAASADPGTSWGSHWLNARDAHQDARTDAGIANGSLTGREVVRIENHEQRLDNATDRALSDGDLSRGEFRRLNHAYNHENRFIYRQKHDRQNQ
jgi:hypothetical protein